ncbi:putative LacI transcription regulator family [Vibrio nigripulchritudo SO65]|nr:putative LacI transcription regulator family [Vibrio nigripulchritudo AM115]CCN41760.1 putative LacI transcription regulator family [Vibrio nigripulchritudo FTn2]CCN66447.1 putative LacI transcription regulator family [Vibrio nigripulchritudo POn4]CCN74541.1 putative LacI transcription regulator family [Vibrio nigripulchritudo SO65]
MFNFYSCPQFLYGFEVNMNIKDVAQLANVSTTTVSRYLNKPELVAPDASERIAKVIELTGYSPRKQFTGVKLNTNPTIGLMIPSLNNPVFAEIASAIQSKARFYGYSTLIIDTQYQSELEKLAIITLLRQRVAGVLLTVSSTRNNEALSLLREFGFPYCLLHNQSESEEACVYVDNYQASREVAFALHKKGHTNFGVVTMDFSASDRGKARFAGYTDALKDLGYDISQITHVELPPNRHAPDIHDDSFCPNSNVTAWFCTNDLLALRTLKALRKQGAKIPENVSVVGFDGMALGMLYHPQLATVSVPYQKMGEVAVDLLLNERIAHNRTRQISRQIEVGHQLMMTGTVA